MIRDRNGPTMVFVAGKRPVDRTKSETKQEQHAMKRRTFDSIFSLGGMVVTAVLVVAGGLLMWGYSFANSQVRNQLAEQQISFPSAAAFAHAKAGTEVTPGMIPYLQRYAGQQLTTGPQAEAYADHFIAVHLSEMPYGGVYSKASAAALADPGNTKLQGAVNTIFKGTTLRGLLLEAYAFWKFGQIALIAGICSFALAAVMGLLSVLGFWHLRRTDESQEILTTTHPVKELVFG
jgi:cytochrome bd-type quinol oxidase subunit 2